MTLNASNVLDLHIFLPHFKPAASPVPYSDVLEESSPLTSYRGLRWPPYHRLRNNASLSFCPAHPQQWKEQRKWALESGSHKTQLQFLHKICWQSHLPVQPQCFPLQNGEVPCCRRLWRKNTGTQEHHLGGCVEVSEMLLCCSQALSDLILVSSFFCSSWPDNYFLFLISRVTQHMDQIIAKGTHLGCSIKNRTT